MLPKFAIVLMMLSTCVAAGPVENGAGSDDTLTLFQVDAEATAAFDRLNMNSDTFLEDSETNGHLNAKPFLASESDNDHTLTKEEYIRTAEHLFRAADLNGDDVLDAFELDTRAGHALQKLLK